MKKLNKYGWMLLFMFVAFSKLFAQKEAYNWYFGKNAAMTFNTSPPSGLTNNAINTYEGVSSISTKDGRLLFYTNGVNVYDSTHTLVPNNVPLKGSLSSSQSSVVVPYPDSPFLYLIFCVTDFGGPNGLTYSIMDMRKNSGRGDVLTYLQNTQLTTPVCEKITAVGHSNGKDYWIVTQKFQSDTIMAFRITPNGVISTPVVSKSGLRINANVQTIGCLKISPDGRQIASVNYTKDSGFIARFDNKTGQCSNFWLFPIDDGYGVEFSPKVNYLYVTNFTLGKLYQYNAKAISRSSFISSRVTVDSSGGPSLGSIQNGPDGKMYYTYVLKSYLSSLTYPDSPGFKTQAVLNDVYLSGKTTQLGLPSFIQSFLVQPDFVYNNLCMNDSTKFALTRADYIDSVHWEFGDTNSGIKNKARGFDNIHHIYNKEGNYKVVSYLYINARIDTIEKIIFIKDVNPKLGNDTFFCKNFLVFLKSARTYLSYEWSNNSSNRQIVVSAPGKYILKALDSLGCYVSDTINILSPRLKIGYEMSDTQICVNQSFVAFKDTSHYTNDSIGTWFWDMGDASSYTDSQFVKKYSDSGVYTVKLKVKSHIGCIDSISKTIKVLGSTFGEILSNSDTQCYNEHRFDFNFSTLSNNLKYSWNSIGIPSSNLIQFDSVVYSNPGSYQVFLYTENYNQCKDTFAKPVFINNNPNADFSINKNKQCFYGNVFEFSNQSNVNGDTIQALKWEFSDSYTQSTEQFQHSFLSEDTFNVRLIAISGKNCTDTINQIVITHPSPIADFDIPNDTQCWQKNYFNFFNKSKLKNGVLYNNWLFGDGTTDTSYNPSNKSYANASATFVISYYATSEHGCKDSAFHTVSLLERPIALFDVNDSIQCFNSHEFNFNDQTTFSALNTLSYFWNYDNGDTSIGKFAKKAQYANFGYKTIELISHSYLTNCYDTFQKLVLVAPHPQSDFEMDFDSLCLNENVFSSNNLSQIPFGTFTSLWNWGDGKTDTFTSGNHSYNNWGQKNIKLIVASNHNCKDSIIKTAMVMPNPKAGFTVNDTAQCMNAQSFDFVSNSIVGIGNVANEWILNNTILMKSLDLSNIDFTTPGYHSVQLNSYSNFGCKDSIVREVFLEKSNQSNAIHLKNDTQCLNGNVFDFNVTSLSPEVSFKSFQWRFGDNQSSNTQLTSHSYLDSGTYEVKVQTVSENNCLDTSALMLRVLPHPMAQFNADSPCFNQSMKFVNLSDTFGNKLSSVVWDLGDGSNSLVYIPEYTYFSQGVFEVTLRLVSEFGCEGELKKEVIVRPKPTAEFSITRLEDKDAEYSTLRMNNLSSTDVSNWRWYFDDKDSSNLENPIAYFKDSNSRPILLVVSNKEGCVDSVMHFTGTLFTEFKLLVPEAFSPDGNNINDVFTVVGSPYVTKFQMEIFNRWGEMVFTTNDISASWDGTYMGEPCEQGLYLCRIYVIPLRGKLQNKNLNILLIR